MVPSGATADDLTTEDTESDGQILRTYPLAELRWELQLSRIPPRKALPMYWK